MSINDTERLLDADIEPLVGRVGDSYDNALAETINYFYKAALIHRCGPGKSFEVVEFETLKWMDGFKHRRRLGPIGRIPPVEAEELYDAAIDKTPIAA